MQSLEEAFLSVIRHSTAAADRLTARPYLATTARILRQLAADHRSVAMIVVVPSLVITLMYFMFQKPRIGRAPRHRSTMHA